MSTITISKEDCECDYYWNEEKRSQIYWKSSKKIIIPDGTTKIGKCVFNFCKNLTSITIPDSVKEIGTGAFKDCSKLTSINIPKGITKINVLTFSNCKNLTSLIIPDSVKEIGTEAFFISDDDYETRKITMPTRFYESRKEIFNNVDNIEFILTGTKELKAQIVKQFIELRNRKIEVPKPNLEKLTYKQMETLIEKYIKLIELFDDLCV